MGFLRNLPNLAFLSVVLVLLHLKNSAAYLDVRLWTVRQLIPDGVLVPIGNKFFIDRLDLDKFIEKTKVGVAA